VVTTCRLQCVCVCVCVSERKGEGGVSDWGVSGVSESMSVCSILKFIYKSVADKLDVKFHNHAKWKINFMLYILYYTISQFYYTIWKINITNNISFHFPSSKDQCVVLKMSVISDVLKLQLLDNKNIIFAYPAIELEM
jgi:hypothetical protein